MKRWLVWTACWLFLVGALAQSEPAGLAAPQASEKEGDKVESVSGELVSGAFGTRTSPVSQPASQNTPVDTSSLLQMVAALIGVALALRYGLPKLVQWSSKSGQGSPLDGEIRVLETRALPGGSLHLVSARGRLLLLGSTTQGLQLIAEIAETEAPVAVSEFERALKQTKTVVAAPAQAEDHQMTQGALLTANEQLQQLLKR
ncbi:MAG: flagellar biosynthetic protein FliO [Fimbriimonadia bacterium]|nr:flagellar biosynthetic protein FliO [Fimbriimonadia bacterium]